jgi:hypothetical protein
MNDKEFLEEYGMTVAEFDNFVANGDWYIEEENNG